MSRSRRFQIALLSALTLTVTAGLGAAVLGPLQFAAGEASPREPELGGGRGLVSPPWFSFGCNELRAISPRAGAPLSCTAHAFNGFNDPLEISCHVPEGLRCELDQTELRPTPAEYETAIGVILAEPGAEPGKRTVTVIATPPEKPYLPGPLAPLRIDLGVTVMPGTAPSPKPSPQVMPTIPNAVDDVLDRVRELVVGEPTVHISCPKKITVASTGTTKFTCTLTPVNGYPWTAGWYGSVPGTRDEFYFELNEGGFQDPFDGRPRQAIMEVVTEAVPQGTYSLTVGLYLSNPHPVPVPKTVIQASVPGPPPTTTPVALPSPSPLVGPPD